MEDLLKEAGISQAISVIDDEHRRLIALFKMLGRSIRAGDSIEYIGALLDELIRYTISDFLHEEILMFKTGYHALDEHLAEHERLLERVSELQQAFRQPGGIITEQDIHFLEHGLTGHILGADLALGNYLTQSHENEHTDMCVASV